MAPGALCAAGAIRGQAGLRPSAGAEAAADFGRDRLRSDPIDAGPILTC